MWIWILVHRFRCTNNGTIFYYSTRWQNLKKKNKTSLPFPNFLFLNNSYGVLCCVWHQGVRETVSLSHGFTGVEWRCPWAY